MSFRLTYPKTSVNLAHKYFRHKRTLPKAAYRIHGKFLVSKVSIRYLLRSE